MTNLITFESMQAHQEEMRALKEQYERRMEEAERLYPEEVRTYGPDCAERRRSIRRDIAHTDYYGVIRAYRFGEPPPEPFTRDLPTQTDWERDRLRAEWKLEQERREREYNSPEAIARREAEDRPRREEEAAAREVLRWMGPCGCSSDWGGGCSICDEQRRAWDRYDAIRRRRWD